MAATSRYVRPRQAFFRAASRHRHYQRRQLSRHGQDRQCLRHPFFSITKIDDLNLIQQELDKPKPALFDVFLDVAQEFEPRLRSRILPDGKIQTPNLEDMYPFLPLKSLPLTCSYKEDA